MSRWIDLFIDAPVEIDALAEELFRLAGLKFCVGPDPTRHTARQGDVVVELSEHQFLDDRQLPLSKYRYDVAARVASASVLDTEEAQLLRRLQGQVRAKGHPALLVFDLQHVVEHGDVHGAGAGINCDGGHATESDVENFGDVDNHVGYDPAEVVR